METSQQCYQKTIKTLAKMVKKLPLLKKQKRPSQSIYKHHNDDNAKLIKQK